MDSRLSKISAQINDSIKVKKNILQDEKILIQIQSVCEQIIEAYNNGNKVLIAGNGGSAADAQHMAGELVSRFYFDRPGLAAIALTTDSSIMTAIGNDYSFERLFSRQIEANGKNGDVFIGISTSGNSANIIEALKEAKNKGIITVGLTGKDGGLMKEECSICICIPSNETPRIQEAHLVVEHIICYLVAEALFKNY